MTECQHEAWLEQAGMRQCKICNVVQLKPRFFTNPESQVPNLVTDCLHLEYQVKSGNSYCKFCGSLKPTSNQREKRNELTNARIRSGAVDEFDNLQKKLAIAIAALKMISNNKSDDCEIYTLGCDCDEVSITALKQIGEVK